MGVILAASPWLIGCSGTVTRTELTQVAVRFVIPPEPEPFANADTDADVRWVVDASYDGFVDTDSTARPVPDAYHVALWGGPFEGNDVTYSATSLAPGSYTFAYLDRPDDSLMQGWLEVNYEGKDLLDYLYKWKNSIPEQKQRLAYDYEISGRTDSIDPAAFKSLTKQLRAFDRLEKRLDAAITAEVKAQTARHQQIRDLLRDAEILILPGSDQVFHATTRAAFSPDDFEAVRAAGALTKMVLVADHQDAQWKLRCVDQLYDDLMRCKAVMGQEADRLERRKGLFLLTDHLHNHDKRFVENETRLQITLGAIDRLDQHMSDLRDRRMALAFISELVAPDGAFRALDQEKRDLLQERVVLQAERHRLDLLFDESNENSARRVDLERNRQHVTAAIVSLDARLADLGKARKVLETMTESTDVIHRQGDTRLLTATVVEDQLPFAIRQAIQRESLMTVRLQTEDNLFVPAKASVARAGAFTPATYPRTPWTGEGQYESPPPSPRPERADAVQFTERQEYEPQVPPPGDKAGWTPPPSPRPAHADAVQFTDWQKQEPQVVLSRDQADRAQSDRDDCPLWLKLLVPPCWLADRDKTGMAANEDRAWLARQPEYQPQQDRYRDQTDWAQSDRDDCPLWLKLLVPPCWLADRDKAKVAAANDDAQLAGLRDKPATPQDDQTYPPQAEEKDPGCPWIVRLLVPPCWIADN